MVVALLSFWNKLAFCDDYSGDNIRTFIKELGRWIFKHSILFDGVQEAVLREAGAVGYFLRQGRREFLDFVTQAAAGAVGHHPDFRFARANKSCDALRSDRDVTSVRHQGVQRNVEAWRQLYFTQILLNLIRLLTGPAEKSVGARFALVVSTGRRNTLSYGEMECTLMGHRFHRGFTAAEKTELWDRWKRGESLKAIGRAFGKPSSSIYFLVAPHGGICPAERRRSRLALTLAEREVISRGVTAHQSARSIARLLGRSPSTVSREMSRNGGYDRYRAAVADENAWARARRPKCCKLANGPRLRQAVAGKLRLDWSPEQIAGWLKRTHPEDECNLVSHETIYRSLFVQTRGVLKKELLSHLRSKRSMRRSRPVDPNGDRRGHIKDIVSIRQRPAAVEDRAVPGHWEGDLLSGPNNSYIATLVERHTRYVMLAKVAGKDTRTVVTALIKQAKKLHMSAPWPTSPVRFQHRVHGRDSRNH